MVHIEQEAVLIRGSPGFDVQPLHIGGAVSSCYPLPSTGTPEHVESEEASHAVERELQNNKMSRCMGRGNRHLAPHGHTDPRHQQSPPAAASHWNLGCLMNALRLGCARGDV